jgi:hypothetical protein
MQRSSDVKRFSSPFNLAAETIFIELVISYVFSLLSSVSHIQTIISQDMYQIHACQRKVLALACMYLVYILLG